MDDTKKDDKNKCACGKVIAKSEYQCEECRSVQNAMEEMPEYNDFNHNFDD